GRPALEHADPAVMRQDLRPALHIGRSGEDGIERGPDQDLVHRVHHGPTIDTATRRHPGRRRISAFRGRSAASSAREYPRRIEVWPSAWVTWSKRSARDPTAKASVASRERRRSETMTARRAIR